MTAATNYELNGYKFGFMANAFFGGNGVTVHPDNTHGFSDDFLEAFKLALFLFKDYEDFVKVTDAYEIDIPDDGVLFKPQVRDVPEDWTDVYQWFNAELQSSAQGTLAAYKRRVAQENVAKSKPKPAPGYVYLLRADNGSYKIGKSKNPANRQKTFGVLLPFDVDYLALIKCENMRLLESALHDRFSDKRINGEWFDLNDDDVAQIKALEAGV